MRGIFYIAAALLCLGASPMKPAKVERRSEALEFTYAWPAEAAAIPKLNARFRSEMTRAYRQALALARENEKMYRSEGRRDIHDYYSKVWTSAGQSSRLLSLQAELGTFTGGAHPNTSYEALLWDRAGGKPVAVSQLFARSGDFAAISRPAYCKALDRERLKRRQGEKLGLAEFDACPKFSQLAVVIADRDRNGRFDRIDFIASPYAAGPYAEGEYVVPLPVTGKLIRALRTEFRASFEIQRQ